MNLAAVVRSPFHLLSYFPSTTVRSIASWNNKVSQYWKNSGKCCTVHKQLSGMARPLWNPSLSLNPANFSVIPNCGMKVKGIPKLRCKDCYYIRKEGRLFVNCDTHPRHKQMEMLIKKKKTWLLSHACMSQYCPY